MLCNLPRSIPISRLVAKHMDGVLSQDGDNLIIPGLQTSIFWSVGQLYMATYDKEAMFITFNEEILEYFFLL